MNNSSLEQLVKSGILDADFLALPTNPVTVSTIDNHDRPEADDDYAARTLARYKASQQQPSRNEPTIQWHGRAQPKDDVDEAPVQTHNISRVAPQLDDQDLDLDLEYYKKCQYHWLYSGRAHGWWHYSKEENIALEDLYRSGSGQAQLTISGKTYAMNFMEMTQRLGGSVRNILRVDSLEHIALIGVAGSRIQKSDVVIGLSPPRPYQPPAQPQQYQLPEPQQFLQSLPADLQIKLLQQFQQALLQQCMVSTPAPIPEALLEPDGHQNKLPRDPGHNE